MITTGKGTYAYLLRKIPEALERSPAFTNKYDFMRALGYSRSTAKAYLPSAVVKALTVLQRQGVLDYSHKDRGKGKRPRHILVVKEKRQTPRFVSGPIEVKPPVADSAKGQNRLEGAIDNLFTVVGEIVRGKIEQEKEQEYHKKLEAWKEAQEKKHAEKQEENKWLDKIFGR